MVSLKVEMQTVSSKLVLADIGGQDTKLSPGDTLENVVHHEIKELGQHVLACTVSYHFPPSSRGMPASEETSDPNLLTFRKFYKFVASTVAASVSRKLIFYPRSQILSPSRPKYTLPSLHQH
jgi:hypothetical protein